MQLMARIATGFVLVLLLGVALAEKPLDFVVDDSNFGYYELEEGHVTLSYQGGVLTVHLYEDPTLSSIPHGFEEIPEISDERFEAIYGAVKPGQSFIQRRNTLTDERERLQELANIGEYKGGFRIIHGDVSMKVVVDSYLRAFQDFGFSVTPGLAMDNVRVFTLSDGSNGVRLVINRVGTGAQVFFGDP